MQRLRRCLMLVLLILPIINCAGAQSSRSEEVSLKTYLQKYDKEQGPSDSALYYAAFFDLNNDGKQEALVYLSGSPVWCGSGGCTLLILTPQGSSYRVVTDMSITRPPILVLSSKTNGWSDLGVRVQGGGIVNGYDVVLKFDGKAYPRNPTISPAKRAVGRMEGATLIPPTEE